MNASFCDSPYNFCKVQSICTNTKQISTEKETLQLKEAAAGGLGSHDVLFTIYVPYKDEKEIILISRPWLCKVGI